MARAPARCTLRPSRTRSAIGSRAFWVNGAMSVSMIPTLFVCHGDDGGPSFHPCRQAQEALRSAGIEYRKVIAGHGSPFPFLRGPRPELLRETGTEKLPTL